MSKKIIILIILITITIGFFGYSYINKKGGVSDSENVDSGENFISTFFSNLTKDKNENEKNENVTNISNNEEEIKTEIQQGRLFKISSMPVAGFTVFMKEIFIEIANPKETEQTQTHLEVLPPSELPPKKVDTKEKKVIPTAPLTEFVPALRYIDKTTGNIYQTFIDKINEKKFSDMKIENLYETYFANNGSIIISRYLKNPSILNTQEIKIGGETIMTHLGLLPKEILGADSLSLNKIEGSFLPENITDIGVSPDTSKIFYLFNWKEGVVGTIASSEGDNKKQVFDSKYTEWLTQWPNENMITLTTKPASFVPGFMYIINPNNSSTNIKKILGGINGLTTLTSPNGKLILYSNNSVSLNIYNIETRETQSLSVKSLPEKCVWGISNDVIYCAVPKLIDTSFSYPDSWYRGEVSFSDDIWRIDVSPGNAKIVFDSDENIDGIKLMLDKDENSLFFINKKDSYLWGFELK